MRTRITFPGQWVHQGKGWYLLIQDLHFQILGQKHVIQKGLLTDGASVPDWVPPFLIPKSQLLDVGAIHDFLRDTYQDRYETRIVDAVFESMAARQIGWFRATLAYYVVWAVWVLPRQAPALFGWMRYRPTLPESVLRHAYNTHAKHGLTKVDLPNIPISHNQ